MDRPAHSPHISVILPRIHGKDKTEQSKKYAGQIVEVVYNGDIVKGGTWFTNFWMPVTCDAATKIKKELNITETNFLGYHLTLCNDKGFINNSSEELKQLSQDMNKGKYTVKEYRSKMLKLKS